MPSGIATDDTTKFFSRTWSIGPPYSISRTGGRSSLASIAASSFRCLRSAEMLVRSTRPSLCSLPKTPPISPIRISVSRCRRRTLRCSTPTPRPVPSSRDPSRCRDHQSHLTACRCIREGDPDGNPWGVSFQRMFDMSNDSKLFRTREQLEADGWVLPKATISSRRRPVPPAIRRQDGFVLRSSSRGRGGKAQPQMHRQAQPRYLLVEEKQDPWRLAVPMYWVSSSEVRSDGSVVRAFVASRV